MDRCSYKKYGINNFDYFLLEKCLREELNQKEYEWSMEYPECYTPMGYNIVVCGSGSNPNNYKQISSYDFNGKKIKTYFCISDAATDVGINATHITSAARHSVGNKSVANLLWNFGCDNTIKCDLPKTNKNGGKTIYQYDLNTGNFIQSFKSVADAEKFLKVNGANKNLSSCCNKKILSAYGYYWSYEKFSNYLIANKPSNFNRKVSMYDKKLFN